MATGLPLPPYAEPELPPHSPARAAAGRLARLSLKELREILRDRRTIVTLLLMPLLLYPLLSLLFQRFLLTSLQPQEKKTYVLGFVSADEERLLVGYLLEAIRIEDARARRPAAAQPQFPPGGIRRLPPYMEGQSPHLTARYVPEGELAARVADFTIDVAVRARRIEEVPNLAPNLPRIECEILFVKDAASSEEALQYLESRLGLVNDVYLARRLAFTRSVALPGAMVQRKGLTAEQSTGISLAAVVPLILILMTITGAVYPAIDLTAGERERGTMEALIAAPVPRFGLLLSKYVAVVTVALLTAAINILAMTITISSVGLGELLFGPRGLSLAAMLQVFPLLVLFAAFFSAVLLTLTSFARSFKEAQAYLVPLMLLAIGPGLASLIPGIKLEGVWVVAPLVNMVLLARDTLAGTVELMPAAVAVLSTVFYALAALALAARIFGTDAILHGSQGGWADLFRPIRQAVPAASLTSAMFCLALLFPCFFLLSNSLAMLAGDKSLALRLVLSAVITLLLFVGFPLATARWGRVLLGVGFRFRPAGWAAFAGALLLGAALWPLAHEVILVGQMLGLGDLSDAKLDATRRLVEQLREISPAVVLACLALAPAFAEELFFRGFLFQALAERWSPGRVILLTAALFGLFHVVASSALATERFLPSFGMGLVLGWVCHRTGSVLPGMLLHAGHNSLNLMLAHYQPALAKAGWGVQEQEHLPLAWLAAGTAISLAGGACVVLATRQREATPQ
jgi:ABC-2 type transport system permease protein/sodium transport system permease protein